MKVAPILAAACVLVASSVARAEPLPPTGPTRHSAMEDAMRRYFRGELRESASFLGVGAGTAFIGGALATQGEFGVGAASAIFPVSAIEIGAAIVLLARTDGQLADLVALHRKSPAEYRAEELPRMRRVKLWFDVYMGVEIGLTALGGASIAFGVVDHRDGFVGAGVGLASQAGAMLTFDLFASARADSYTEHIERLTPEIRPVVGPTGVGVEGRF